MSADAEDVSPGDDAEELDESDDDVEDDDADFDVSGVEWRSEDYENSRQELTVIYLTITIRMHRKVRHTFEILFFSISLST